MASSVLPLELFGDSQVTKSLGVSPVRRLYPMNRRSTHQVRFSVLGGGLAEHTSLKDASNLLWFCLGLEAEHDIWFTVASWQLPPVDRYLFLTFLIKSDFNLLRRITQSTHRRQSNIWGCKKTLSYYWFIRRCFSGLLDYHRLDWRFGPATYFGYLFGYLHLRIERTVCEHCFLTS